MIYKINKKTIAISSKEECLSFLEKTKTVGLDIETTKKYQGKVYGNREGLDPYTSEIIMLQFGNETTQYILDTRVVDKKIVIEILEKINEKPIIGHNLKFEYKHILHNYGVRLKDLNDTMIAESVIECGDTRGKLGLKQLAVKYLGEEWEQEIDKSTRIQFLDIGDKEFSEEQLIYGALDIVMPCSIIKAQKRKLQYLDLQDTFSFEKQFIPVLGEMEYNGKYINRTKWMDIYRKNLERFYSYEKQLNTALESNPDMFAPFLDDGKANILWTSSKQVIPVMQTIGVDTWVKDKIKTKKTGKASYKHSVEAKHLRKYLHLDLVKMYLKYKTLEKYVTSYGEKFLDNVNPITGRIHPDFWQIVNTGRTSCQNPNLQNITSGEFRDCFTATDEEHKLVCCDFSSQEPRVTAHYCQDPALMELFLKGDGDTHSLIARKVFEVIENKPQIIDKHNEGWSEKFNMTKRKVGKTINLGLDYGKSAFSLKADLGITQEEAEDIYNAVRNAFPLKEKYFEKKRVETFKNGYVLIDPIIKRKSFVKASLNRYKYLSKKKDKSDEERSELFSIEGSLQRDSNNYPTQGTAASMTKQALILIYQWQDKNKAWNKFKVVNAVHDEIVVESTIDYTEKAAKVVQWAMIKAGKIFCSTIPMVAEPIISDKWEH
jgi:DNA polymerase-1